MSEAKAIAPEELTFATVEEFLAWENQQPERYEFIFGAVRMMTGGTADHNTIALNIALALRSRLRGKACRTFSNDFRVIAPTGDMMYPDVMVVCGAVGGQTTHTEVPTVVVEVLSQSTREVDHARKRWAYRSIATLQHYLLVDQTWPIVELSSRAGDGWSSVIHEGLDGSLSLPALDIELPLAEVFEDVVFLAERPRIVVPRRAE